MTNRNIIETFDISHQYKLKGKKSKLNALEGINLAVKEGEIFGLLGPNGAGKTTLINIFTTILHPTSGYAIINGYNIFKDPKKVKNSLALMLDNHMIYYRVTAYDNLKFFCKIYKVPNYKEKIPIMLKKFGLEKWANQYVENFSSGMKNKLALCRTLLLERKILFLDEPTLGLDVQSVSFMIEQIKNANSTVFLTSHDMSVVEKLCDRIAFINNGKIVRVGTQNELKQIIKNEITINILIKNNKNQLQSELRQQEYVLDTVDDNNENLIVTIKERKKYKDLLFILSKYDILKVKEQELSLGDLFLKLI